MVNKPSGSNTPPEQASTIPSHLANGRFSQASMRSNDSHHSRNNSIISPTMSPIDGPEHHFHHPAHQPPPPSRLSYFRRPSVSSFGTVTSTIASTSYAEGIATNHPDLPALITSRDVNETINCYSGVVKAAQRYREALFNVSAAAAEFGSALESCAKCKGAGSSAESLLAAGGLHYLVSNHQQILAKSIQRTFEAPVTRQMDLFKATMVLNDEEFKKELKTKTRELKRHEMENMRLSRMRVRNLAAYRSSLLELTSQIDDIDRLKYEHFCQVYDVAQNTSTNILTCAASVVRAEVEIYEGVARKGWSGGGLDDLIATCPDPFASPEEDEFDTIGGASISKSSLVTINGSTAKTGNKFVETMKGFWNPSQSVSATGSSTVTSGLKNSNTNSSSVSKSLPSGPPSPTRSQPHVKRPSLFSILPSKSILPSLDSQKSAIDDSVSYESEEDRGNSRLDDKSNILDGIKDLNVNEHGYKNSNEKVKDNVNSSGISKPHQIRPLMVSQLRNSGGDSSTESSPSSSVFSGFTSQTKTSTPLGQRGLGIMTTKASTSASSSSPISPKHDNPAHDINESSPSRLTLGSSEGTNIGLSSSTVSASGTTPATGSSVESTTSSTTTAEHAERKNLLHGGPASSVADSDYMLGYNGWDHVPSTMSSTN